MRLDHINISTDNLEQVKESLVRLLNLEAGYRPAFQPPGYWLYGEGYPIIHLTGLEENPGESTGALNHVSFKDDDYDGLVERLEKDEMEYRLQVVPGSGIKQIFFTIDHQIMVEVDFDPESEN